MFLYLMKTTILSWNVYAYLTFIKMPDIILISGEIQKVLKFKQES